MIRHSSETKERIQRQSRRAVKRPEVETVSYFAS